MKSYKQGFWITSSSLNFVKERSGFVSNHLKRGLSSNILPTGFSPQTLKPFKYINQKFRKAVNFYEEFSGLKDVKLAQEKVGEIGERLEMIQSERRKAFDTLLEIQSNLKVVQAQLQKTKRGDDQYIPLITEEDVLMKQENMQQEKFKDIEKAERDQFTLYSNSVKTAHEKEKSQSQKTKYWSLIGSVVGTLIGIIGSSLNSQRKKSELKNMIAETTNSKLELEFKKFLESYKEVELSRHSEEIRNVGNKVTEDLMKNTTVANNSKIHEYLNEVLVKTNSILVNVEETIKIMQNINQFELYRIKSDNGSDALFMNLQSLKDALHLENQQIRSVIWNGCCIIGGAIILRMLLPK